MGLLKLQPYLLYKDQEHVHKEIHSTSEFWLEALSFGIVINLIFRPRNRNQFKKLESDSIFLGSGGIPGMQLFLDTSNQESSFMTVVTSNLLVLIWGSQLPNQGHFIEGTEGKR